MEPDSMGRDSMGQAYIGGLDIGGTKIAATVANAENLLSRVTQPTVKSGSIRAVAEQAVALMAAACTKAGLQPGLLNAVGVSSCGPFARVDGMLGLATPNICGGLSRQTDLPNTWDVIPLEKVLREHFATVVIENDCLAALVAERTFGAARGERDCVYVTWSTGIGFGLCVDGHLLHGKQGNAGHAGHMLMDAASDVLCGCGNRGDLEALISGRGIGRSSGLSASALFDAAKGGEGAARDAVAQAAQWFGRALYNIAVVLDTRLFVIGGSVWQHHGAWLAPLVLREIETRLPALTAGVSVAAAELGVLVADVGALALVMPADWVEKWSARQPWRAFAA